MLIAVSFSNTSPPSEVKQNVGLNVITISDWGGVLVLAKKKKKDEDEKPLWVSQETTSTNNFKRTEPSLQLSLSKLVVNYRDPDILWAQRYITGLLNCISTFIITQGCIFLTNL